MSNNVNKTVKDLRKKYSWVRGSNTHDYQMWNLGIVGTGEDVVIDRALDMLTHDMPASAIGAIIQQLNVRTVKLYGEDWFVAEFVDVPYEEFDARQFIDSWSDGKRRTLSSCIKELYRVRTHKADVKYEYDSRKYNNLLNDKAVPTWREAVSQLQLATSVEGPGLAFNDGIMAHYELMYGGILIRGFRGALLDASEGGTISAIPTAKAVSEVCTKIIGKRLLGYSRGGKLKYEKPVIIEAPKDGMLCRRSV